MKGDRSARILGVTLSAVIVFSPCAVAGEDDPPGRASSTYFVVAGAPDEAVGLDVRLDCKAAPQADEAPPPFGASFDVLVFEPGTPTPALEPFLVTIGETQGRARVEIPLTGFSGPAVVAFDNVDLRGPCSLSIDGRQYDAGTGRTRAAIRPLGDRLVVRPAENDEAAWVGGGDAFSEELQGLVVPCLCKEDSAEEGRASFRLVASEPSGIIAPVIVDVELGSDSAVPLPGGDVLLVGEVSVPSDLFCPTDGRCTVELAITDLDVAGGCRPLPPLVRLSDRDTGRTVAMVYQNYALYPRSN